MRNRSFFGGGGGDDDDDDFVDPVLAAGRGDGGAAAVGLSNEAFRAAGDDDGAAGPSYAGPSGAALPADKAGPPVLGPMRPTSDHPFSSTKPGADGGLGLGLPEALLSGVQFKEINGKELRYVDPSRREANAGIRNALGAEFESRSWISHLIDLNLLHFIAQMHPLWRESLMMHPVV